MGKIMVRNREKENPYFWCPNCKQLSPIHILNGVRLCMKCSYAFEKEEGGRVVMFTAEEAKLRNLPWIKNPSTGELNDED